MGDYAFSLPFPPSVNSLRACVHGRMITSKKGREYFKEVERVMIGLGLHGEGITGQVVVSLVMHAKTLRKYDVSNFLKAYEDSLVKCNFIEDDHLIEYGSIKKGEKIKEGRLDVSITLK